MASRGLLYPNALAMSVPQKSVLPFSVMVLTVPNFSFSNTCKLFNCFYFLSKMFLDNSLM
nr:MAG TPA: hypothetical protein [Caudoviricetes sp.]